MNRKLAFLFILLVWAAVYLPGLGGRALKGEEARRILPAITMLETGNWVVPYLNGLPYLRKPPLINWSIASSLALTGERNERAARIPSILAVLAMAVAIFWTGTRWLSTPAAFAASLMSLLGVGLWEKGRMAEIDALYSALTGIAFGLWFAAWVNRRTGFRLWFWPMVCLGVGLLAKGPMHLFLFYLVVIPVLVAAGEKRQLWSVAHLASWGVAILIFATWALPYLKATASLNAASVWVNQMQNTMGRGCPGKLLLNEFDTVANCLPWILLAPLWWSRRVLAGLDERRRLLVRVARWSIVVGFLGPVLINGMVPRYSLPLYPSAALLLALVLPSVPSWVRAGWGWFSLAVVGLATVGMVAGPWLVRPGSGNWLALLPFLILVALFPVMERRISAGAGRFVISGAFAFAALVAFYGAVVVPRVNRVAPPGPVVAGKGINAAVPSGAVLYIIDPGYEPAFFYIRRACVFVRNAEELPPDSHYVLVSAAHRRGVTAVLPGVHEVGLFPGLGKRQLLLVEQGD